MPAAIQNIITQHDCTQLGCHCPWASLPSLGEGSKAGAAAAGETGCRTVGVGMVGMKRAGGGGKARAAGAGLGAGAVGAATMLAGLAPPADGGAAAGAGAADPEGAAAAPTGAGPGTVGAAAVVALGGASGASGRAVGSGRVAFVRRSRIVPLRGRSGCGRVEGQSSVLMLFSALARPLSQDGQGDGAVAAAAAAAAASQHLTLY